eukprot:COSAG02_NODE_61463_length_268_cov_0.917160_1_plen_55_part_10
MLDDMRYTGHKTLCLYQSHRRLSRSGACIWGPNVRVYIILVRLQMLNSEDLLRLP